MRRKLLPRTLHLPPTLLHLLPPSHPPLETSHTNRLHLTLLYAGAARGQGEGGRRLSNSGAKSRETFARRIQTLSDVSFRYGHAALLANAGPLTHTHGRHCTGKRALRSILLLKGELRLGCISESTGEREEASGCQLILH